MDLFMRLGIALAVGLLIGVERGWQQRGAAEGQRIAGLRTFGLIGLLGGLWGLVARHLGDMLLGFGFLAVAALMITAYSLNRQGDRNHGVTSVVAALVTFTLGALAVRGYQHVAAAAAVVTAVLLSLKAVLHGWLQRLEKVELQGALLLLLISVVLLPVLPNRGYGPWQALNPYEIWWMVVLIAGISFAGYVAIKLAGTRRGILLTGFLGGLVSSTVTTLDLSRLGRRANLQAVAAVGVLAACATMFPRIAVEVAVINAALLRQTGLPLLLMTLVTVGGALWLWHRAQGATGLPAKDEPVHRNPFELEPALKFGLLLALVMFLAHLLQAWFGEAGVYLLAAVSGLSDVDAITLSLSRLARTDLAAVTAARAIILAAVVNTGVKGALVLLLAGGGMGRKVAPVLIVTMLVGLASVAAGLLS
jgi:uncharacterized membrane protein (DUF4010 family)